MNNTAHMVDRLYSSLDNRVQALRRIIDLCEQQQIDPPFDASIIVEELAKWKSQVLKVLRNEDVEQSRAPELMIVKNMTKSAFDLMVANKVNGLIGALETAMNVAKLQGDKDMQIAYSSASKLVLDYLGDFSATRNQPTGE